MIIINLTQHPSTADQQIDGVVDLEGAELALLKALLTFEEIPSREEIGARAERLAELAIQNGLGADADDDPIQTAAMIGGAPYLMAPLESALAERGIRPLYSFTRRESIEEVQADGSTRKTAIFRHIGFVEAVHEPA